MLSVAQQELLDSLIGKEGIYFETSIEYAGVDLGTKLLYLDRALSQNCQDFLKLLDKLHQPGLPKQAGDALLEFIRALKFINDLYFNNEVKYGEHGLRATLSHYFAALGKVDPEDFKLSIETMMKAQKLDLSKGHEDEILAQQQARLSAESKMVREVGARVQLDLPEDQRSIPSLFFKKSEYSKEWHRNTSRNEVHYLRFNQQCIGSVVLIKFDDGRYRLRICAGKFDVSSDSEYQRDLNRQLVEALNSLGLEANAEYISHFPDPENSYQNYLQIQATAEVIGQKLGILLSLIENLEGASAREYMEKELAVLFPSYQKAPSEEESLAGPSSSSLMRSSSPVSPRSK